MGGAVAAVESGYMKQQLVESNARRVEAIERGEQIVVGVNRFIETEPRRSPTRADAILTVSEEAEAEQIARLEPGARRATTRPSPRRSRRCARAAKNGANIMPASIACAKAGVTTGEWGVALRAAFGEYRAPTGVGTAHAQRRRRASTTSAPRSIACRRSSAGG